MKTGTFQIPTTQQTNTATVSTLTPALTGTTNLTLSFDQIDQSKSTVNKIIATYYDDREFVFNRDLTSGNLSSLSATTLTQTIHNDLVDEARKPVQILLHRDDGITDSYTVEFRVFKSELDDYTDVNLIKTDFIDAGQAQDNLLLTFEADDPGIVGTSLLSSNTNDYFFYDSGTTATSSCSTEVGFEDEYAFVQAALSHATFNVSADGCADGGFKLKYRTRTGIGTAIWPGVGNFDPALPNSQFIHVTGFLNFHPLEETRVKDINIPLVDILGASLKPGIEFKIENVSTGVGTSLQPLSGGYFFVDLFDVDGCETVTVGTSTLTAYITYN